MSDRRSETKPMRWHPDFNTTNGCALCGKSLEPNPRRRYIHVGQGGASILRADLPTVEGREGVMLSTGYDTGDMGWFEVGDGCARKLGLEWSKVLPPLEVTGGAQTWAVITASVVAERMPRRAVSVRVQFELETTLSPGELEQVVLDTLVVSPGSREAEIGELLWASVESIVDVESDESEAPGE